MDCKIICRSLCSDCWVNFICNSPIFWSFRSSLLPLPTKICISLPLLHSTIVGCGSLHWEKNQFVSVQVFRLIASTKDFSRWQCIWGLNRENLMCVNLSLGLLLTSSCWKWTWHENISMQQKAMSIKYIVLCTFMIFTAPFVLLGYWNKDISWVGPVFQKDKVWVRILVGNPFEKLLLRRPRKWLENIQIKF